MKEFALVNGDMQIFALENFQGDKPLPDENTVLLNAMSVFDDGLVGQERVKAHKQTIMLTIAKMLRKGTGFFTARDEAAIAELKKNVKLYLTTDIVMLDYLRILNNKHKRANIEKNKKEKMFVSIQDVSVQILERAGVSKSEYD